MDTLLKHGSHDQKTHSPHGIGSKSLFENLSSHLNPLSAKIDKEFQATQNLAAANDLVRAKTNMWSAGKATTPAGAAESLLNAKLSVASAARKISSTSAPSAIRLSDVSQQLKRLYTGLLKPAGG